MNNFRFTIRDLLWLMVVVGLVLVAWWEWQRANQAVAERDEAIERWHEASKKWVEVNRKKAEEWGGEFRQHGRMGGGAAVPAPATASP